MKKRLFVGFLALLSLFVLFTHAQKVEIVDGVRIVHNEKNGKWGKDIQVSLELIRTLGGLEVEDENLAFNSPRDVLIDSAGNLYILDYSNNCIQKLSSNGEYISTLGQQGQGPGDLSRPYSMDIDKDDNIYILDSGNRRIQIINTEGEVQKIIRLDRLRQDIIRTLPSGLIALGGRLDMRWVMSDEEKMPKLIEFLDRNGKIQKAIGELKDFKDRLVNREGNVIHYDVNQEGELFLSFSVQNRLGEIQLDHLANSLRIQKGYLFIFDAENAQVFQYEITEQSQCPNPFTAENYSQRLDHRFQFL